MRLGPAPTTSPNSATAENAKLQGDPISGALALRDVRQSGGGFVAVSDAELLEAMRVLATAARVLAEPAGAAAYAGLLRALECGLLDWRERVVILVTGTLLKAPRFARSGRVPVEVDADLGALERHSPAWRTAEPHSEHRLQRTRLVGAPATSQADSTPVFTHREGQAYARAEVRRGQASCTATPTRIVGGEWLALGCRPA